MSYIPIYGLEETSTFIRTTLRYPDFCKGWDCIIKTNLTDENPFASFASKQMNYREWLDKSISLHTSAKNFDDFLNLYVPAADQALIKNMFAYADLLSEKGIPLTATSSADVLQFVLENKLFLLEHDKDMIVMLHEFEYTIDNTTKKVNSSLIVKGENSLHTAMAKTVGLPLGIAAKLILNGTIKTTGLHIPIVKEIYGPVLKELEQHAIQFNEQAI